MVKLSSTALLAGFGGLALSLTMGVGVALAAPDMSPIVNTTCNYGQVKGALNAMSPEDVERLNNDMQIRTWVKNLLDSSPTTRQRMVDKAFSDSGKENADDVLHLFNTCGDY